MQACMFDNVPIIIAIRDDEWARVQNDAFDNDPAYYQHHDSGESEYGGNTDGFVPRGEHWVLVFVTKEGVVGIRTGCHKDEIPAQAHVKRG